MFWELQHCWHFLLFILLQTFHVAGLRLDRPRFLNKSSVGFIIFNVFMYVIFLIHLITTELTDKQTKVSLVIMLFIWKLCVSLWNLMFMYLIHDIFHTTVVYALIIIIIVCVNCSPHLGIILSVWPTLNYWVIFQVQ